MKIIVFFLYAIILNPLYTTAQNHKSLDRDYVKKDNILWNEYEKLMDSKSDQKLEWKIL